MRFPKACASFLAVLTLFSGCGIREVKEETKDAFQITNAEITDDQILDLCIIQADTLNPLRTTVRHNAEVLSLLYDSLFVLTDENKATPNLCTNLSVSEKDRRVTLSIRENVYFQDGTTLKPKDVAATVNFILSSEGFYKERLSCIESVRANGKSIELFLKEETERIENLLDFPILPEKHLENYEEHSFLEKPIAGSGLYSLEEYRINQVIKLKVNKTHHSGNAPSYEKINIHLLPDEKTAIYMLENKELDALSESALDENVYTPPAQILLKPYPTDRLVFLGMKEEQFGVFLKQIKTFLPSWVSVENIGEMTDETNAQEEKAPAEVDEGNVTLLYCLDSFLQTRTAQKILRELEENAAFVTGESASKKEYVSRVQSGAYDLFLGEIRVLPNRDKNDFLEFQMKNSPAKIARLFYINEMFYFQEEIAVDDIKTKNPYLYFTERQ